MMEYNEIIDRSQIEKQENWDEWCSILPSFHFKKEWDVKIIPPFFGAIIRFTIDYNNKHVSVYFDAYDRLGFYGEPYFEAYPIDGDSLRYPLNMSNEMMKDIERELEG